MIQKIIDKHLEKMAKEVLKTNDPMVLRFLKETKENGADEDTQLEAMVSILTDVICAREMDPEETLHEGIQSFLDIMEMHNESYDFTVTLKDDVIKSTRKITLPAYMMLSDLTYAVLCAFDGMGSHLFHLQYKKDIFGLIEDFDEMKDMLPADMLPLGALDLRKRSVIHMVYDMGENWEFEIKCTGRNQVDFMVNVPMLRGGEGYNIWEDSRYLLEMLVKNPQSIAFNHEGQDITVQECAEGEHITLFREEQMDEFIEEIMEMKQIYEQDFFDSQTDSSWSDFDAGYQA